MAWYDFVDSQRQEYLAPKILNLTRKLNRGAIESLEIEFEPLWQLDEKEEADVRVKVSQADAVYLDRGVLDPAEVAVSRFGQGGFSMETKLDVSTRVNPEKETPPAPEKEKPEEE